MFVRSRPDATSPASTPPRSRRRTGRSADTSPETRSSSHDDRAGAFARSRTCVLTKTLICVAARPIVPGPISSENRPSAGIARVERRPIAIALARAAAATESAAGRARRRACRSRPARSARRRAAAPAAPAPPRTTIVADVEHRRRERGHEEVAERVQHAHEHRGQRDQRQKRRHDARQRRPSARTCRAPRRSRSAKSAHQRLGEDDAERRRARR